MVETINYIIGCLFSLIGGILIGELLGEMLALRRFLKMKNENKN